MLRTANRLAIAGTVFLAVGMTAALFLVTDIVFHWAFTIVLMTLVAVLFAWFWYGLPLSRRLQRR